ncbi:serine/threonine-protein kinase, partial [Parolsenella catena]|uniref:serine/threonine-protein kinase n=1 Tax=Parolsenella catena TaxID=2003188 RepID=UPI003AEF5349
MTTTNETDETHDELAAALRGAVPPAADAYRVERVLKSAPGELTQLVYLRTAAGGELGPYVRKVIDRESGLGGAYVSLAAREREGLRVRQLPRIIECGVERGSLVVVMERVPGHTLREVIEAASPAQRVELAARLMPAVCDAAEELHTTLEQPIVHRDLTPGNVMCPDGDPTTPVLIDLGIARSWREDAETDTTHFGTRAYAPPEQYGFGQTDVRSDVYALGLLAFFCLTGRDPSPSGRERAFADPAVPEPWRVAIERAAALDPAERYQTAGELAAALRG